jgi:hypothetical protein
MANVSARATQSNAWMMYALFTGKLIRILATGAETRALAKVRGEFAYDLAAMAEGRHWSNRQ